MNPFTPQAMTTLANLAQDYEHVLDIERSHQGANLVWRRRGERDYLYRIKGSVETSLGLRDAQTQTLFDQFQENKRRLTNLNNRLRMTAALCKTQRLPLMPAHVGKVLRALDADGQLGGGGVLVVGTHAMLAYAYDMHCFLDQDLGATQDLDLAWMRDHPLKPMQRPVVDALKQVDATWTINQERPWQLLNQHGDEVELLLSSSKQHAFVWSGLQPTVMPEQDWLLLGQPLDLVVPTHDRYAARLVVPDPRYFALQKMWISHKVGRDRLKIDKDRAQARVVWGWLTQARHTSYPIDDDFLQSLPSELAAFVPQLVVAPATRFSGHPS